MTDEPDWMPQNLCFLKGGGLARESYHYPFLGSVLSILFYKDSFV